MKWSFKIARLWGIDVYLHVTFLLFLGLMGLQDGLQQGSVSAGVRQTLLLASLFVCVLLHEYGHALAARRYGIRTRDITLLPIGGVARLERLPDKPRQELVVALAGPLVNVAIATCLFVGMKLGGVPVSFQAWVENPSALHTLLLVNVSLVLFNLLPAFPMDGGRVLRALLAMALPPARATQIAAVVGRVMAVGFAVVGVVFHVWMLVFIAVFVWLGAGQEAQAAVARSAFAGVRVAQAMMTDFYVLNPAEPIRRAVDLLLAGTQQDFPVMEADRVVGSLGRKDLFAELSRNGSGGTVGSAMAAATLVLDADEPLEQGAMKLQESGLPFAVVWSAGRPVGLLTMENVGEFVVVRQALATGRRMPPIIVPPSR